MNPRQFVLSFLLWHYRCICPSGTHGPRCKFLSRHFEDDGNRSGSWVWLDPLTPCTKLLLSVMVLTRSRNGTIMTTFNRGSLNEMGLWLGLQNGRPVLNFNLERNTLVLKSDLRISDYQWHRVDISWMNRVRRISILTFHCVNHFFISFCNITYDGLTFSTDSSARCSYMKLFDDPFLIWNLNFGPAMTSLSYGPIFCLESQKIDGTYQRYNHYF